MRKFIALLLILAFPAIAQAGAFDILDTTLKSGVKDVTNTLQTVAIIWLSSFVLIQMFVTNFGLLKSGADIEAIYGKLIGSLMWFVFCFYVLQNGAGFIESVSKGFFVTAAGISGVGGFNPGLIIDQGATLAANLVGKINDATSITSGLLPALIGGLLGVTILATAALIAFKVFLINIETMLIVMIAPMSFSFLGLNALKDQGIAPFKSLISLIYRILILVILVKTMGSMTDNLSNIISQINDDSIDGIWSTLFAAVMGYVLLAFLVVKSDSIAANLASGTTNLGTADVASAAAMGAAAGAAVVAGGAATGAAATKVPQSMAGFMSNLSGGGSLSNASGRGSGGASDLLKPTAPVSSVAGNAASSFPTTSQGAPRKTNEAAGSGAPASGDMQQQIKGDAARVASAMNSVGGDPVAAADKQNRPGGGNGSSAQPASTAAAGSTGTSTPQFETNKSGAPVRPSGTDSAASANIMGQNTDPQLANPNSQNGSNNQTSFGGYLKEFGRHVEQEKASTSVSINVNAAD